MPDLVDVLQPTEHSLGRKTALVTLIEYADFTSRTCRDAAPILKALLSEFGTNIRILFRHYPGDSEEAQLAAEAAEAAAAQGRFWAMHDKLFQHQDDLEPSALVRYAYLLGLDLDRFARDLIRRRFRASVERDIESGNESGVDAAPTFFLNGSRYAGDYSYDRFRAIIARLIGRDAEILYSE